MSRGDHASCRRHNSTPSIDPSVKLLLNGANFHPARIHRMAKSQRYQDIYPSEPLLRSSEVARASAADLLSLEYFEAEPDMMPRRVYEQHHILLNLLEQPQRVENWRDGELRDFIYQCNEVVVTPAGVESGWRWHVKSKVIVITLEPAKFEKFAQQELGILLNPAQLKNIPQFIDQDITQAGVMLLEALKMRQPGSDVMYESLARVFLVKLLNKYGLEQQEELEFSRSFTSKHYKKVLDYVAQNYSGNVTLDKVAEVANMSSYHFSRLFKQTIGQSPHQFVMSYRIEQAKKMLKDMNRGMLDIALSCGFADQAHFSRVFKQLTGSPPKVWRQQLAAKD